MIGGGMWVRSNCTNLFTYGDRSGLRVNCVETKDTITITQVEMRENETKYYKQLNNSLAEKNKIKKHIINSLAIDIKQTNKTMKDVELDGTMNADARRLALQKLKRDKRKKDKNQDKKTKNRF